MVSSSIVQYGLVPDLTMNSAMKSGGGGGDIQVLLENLYVCQAYDYP
jgi:hypothetical protein